MHFLTPVNFPPSGPAILTAIRRSLRTWFGVKKICLEARCPHCARYFEPPSVVTATLASSASHTLTSASLADPRLLSPCPHCGGALEFNPFVVDSKL
jgi:hypothetical protein